MERCTGLDNKYSVRDNEVESAEQLAFGSRSARARSLSVRFRLAAANGTSLDDKCAVACVGAGFDF